MIRRSLVVALAVVTAVNVAMVMADVRNRRTTADASVELDERELTFVPPPPQGSTPGLRWKLLAYPVGYEPWLDRHKLESLGFDCSVAPGEPRARAHYRNQLTRPAYVALQLGGAERDARVAAWIARLRLSIHSDGSSPDHPGGTETGGSASRLVAVDGGLDSAALRERYPDRQHVLIVRAVFRAWLDPGVRGGGGPAVRGSISALLPTELQPALPERRALQRLIEGRDWNAGDVFLRHPPRYLVGVTNGAEFRPYVLAIWPEDGGRTK